MKTAPNRQRASRISSEPVPLLVLVPDEPEEVEEDAVVAFISDSDLSRAACSVSTL